MYAFTPLSDLPPDRYFHLLSAPENPEKFMDDIDISPRQVNHRDLHRSPEFEDRMTLVDQKFRLTTEIEALRSENDKLKKELQKKEKELNITYESIIDLADRHEEEREGAFHLRRVMNAQKQLDELNVLMTELTSQYNFLHQYFSFFKEEDLRGYTGLQNNQVYNESNELAQMEQVLTKAYQRLDGPVEKQKIMFNEQAQTIQELSGKLKQMRLVEFHANVTAYYQPAENEVLPEELLAKKKELQKRLEVLQHRKYLRNQEMMKKKQQKERDRIAAEEVLELEEKKRKEDRERERFRNRMQKKHREEEAEKQRMKNVVILNDDFGEQNEKWKMMITHVNEAHD